MSEEKADRIRRFLEDIDYGCVIADAWEHGGENGVCASVWLDVETGKTYTSVDAGNTEYRTENFLLYSLDGNWMGNEPFDTNSFLADDEISDMREWDEEANPTSIDDVRRWVEETRQDIDPEERVEEYLYSFAVIDGQMTEDIVLDGGRPPTKDELIVRQTCIKAASEVISSKVRAGKNIEVALDDCITALAENMESWVWRNK